MIPAGIILLVIFGGRITDVLFPTAIKGHLIDAVYIPDTNGAGRLWFQTDDSFYYASTVETDGSLSIGTGSLFNKTYTYLYDPAHGKVLQRTLQRYPKTPPQPRMFRVRDAILFVTPAIGSLQEANIELRDPRTGNVARDLTGFIQKFPALSAGIAELSVYNNLEEPVHFRIKTRDGQEPIYDPSADRLFAGYTEYERFQKQIEIPAETPQTITRFALYSPGSSRGLGDARLWLYKVTGPPSKLVGESLRNLDTPEGTRDFDEVVHLVPEQAFLEGLIVYQDNDLVVILHQNQIGRNAVRMLTSVDVKGRALWTIPQAQLFPELSLNESDHLSETFFIKNRIHTTREGGLFVFKMDGIGLMGIDIGNGAKKWDFRPN